MTIKVKNDEMLGRTDNTTLHIELMKLQQERDRYKQMYEMEKALFVDADLKIERAIEYMKPRFMNCIDNEKRYFEDYYIQEIYEILKGDKKC